MASASKRRRKDEAPGIAAGSNDGGRAFYREQLSEEGLRSGATQIQNVFNKDGGFQSTQSLASGESGGDVVACKPQGSMFGNFKESDSPLSLRADTEPNSVPQNGNGGPQHWPSTTPISSPTARTAAVIMLNKGPTDGPSLSRAEEDGGSERELQSGNVADNRTVFEDLGNGHQREGDAQGLEKEARRNSEAGMSRGFGGWVNGRRWDSSDEVKNEASHHSRDQGYTYDQSPQGGNGGLRSERWVQEDNSPHKAANGGFSFRIPEGNQNLQNLLGKRDTASERTPQEQIVSAAAAELTARMVSIAGAEVVSWGRVAAALGASPHQWPFHPASQNTMSAAESSSMPHPEVATTVQQQQQPLPAGSFPSYPPPAAFLGPKCALWDCLRPAQGDYCSELHAAMAATEGGNGRAPVVRPWGIELKDPLLLAALRARIAGKAVGIPDCEKAATAKSPWGAPELFDVNMLVGEPLREWLFFDKSQPAYGTGTRKQRALPDYSGRWHDSYKQHFKDHGGLKRILYLDPQPSGNVEWHLYEYELKGSSEWALYRLEMKKRDPTKAVNSVLIQSSQRGGHKSAFTVVKPRPL